MKETAEFKIIYDGSDLQNNRMNVKDLAPALLSISQLFEEANRVLNGNETTIKLHIQAVEAGSFVTCLELCQSIKAQVSGFLTGDFVTSVLNLKELLFGTTVGLFWLIKKLKGRSVKKIQDLPNDMIRIEFNHEQFDVPMKLLNLYQEIAIRQAAEGAIKPLRCPGVSLFQVMEQGKVIEQVVEEETDFFIPPATNEEEILKIEKEIILYIIALTFKEENKWRLSDGSNIYSVIISDKEFLRKVENNLISFSKGDSLKCCMQTTQWQTMTGIRAEYEVLKVLEHKSALRQLSIFENEPSNPKS